ncbi:partner of xrn-2 protein 1-like [Topomyia yanbarensis]|uniref:partner of xrn-2 protein 1-like n=1 Tax=Topomyia yanbarensis TaxID=2498891 RepID=UPI00273BD125|nr:partner of xrn-2 protein 1-like [Topomyia yanbarensis]
MACTSFNVDKYKTIHECDEHWELRKMFMERYKDRFEEDELVCLAQVFTNVEFLRCRYPAETMALIAELSKDVAAEFRQSRESKLKRTFVAASDAAAARYAKK